MDKERRRNSEWEPRVVSIRETRKRPKHGTSPSLENSRFNSSNDNVQVIHCHEFGPGKPGRVELSGTKGPHLNDLPSTVLASPQNLGRGGYILSRGVRPHEEFELKFNGR